MKNIQDLKNKYELEFSEKYCDLKDISKCRNKFCYCAHTAEAWAYIDSVIPDGFRKFSIFDFKGVSKNMETSVPNKVVFFARNKVAEYCWGYKWDDILKKTSTDKEKHKDSVKEFLRLNSVMDKRLEEGNNVVIFGSSTVPIGRTMVASIIMKEAIKLRMKSSKRANQTYDWVDYASLKQLLKEDSMDVVDYRSADWLVVDNIIVNSFSSLKQKAFVSDLVNPFFTDRFNKNLPTILVFKFDIRLSSINIEDSLGTGIYSILNSDKTFKIPLSEDNSIIKK